MGAPVYLHWRSASNNNDMAAVNWLTDH